MGLSSYRSALIFRIAGLLAVMMLFSILVTQQEWMFTSTIIGIFLVFQIFDFVRFSFRFSRDIETYIKTLEESGSTSKARSVKHSSRYKEVEGSFDRIQHIVQQARIEREVQHNLLNILLENIPSGIITLSADNRIKKINRAAKSILNFSGDVQWSHIQSIFPQFTEQIKQSNYSKNELISLDQNDSIQLSYSITTIKLLDETLKVVNFQNIKSVLDRNEMQAWNNLIRTMTHEIMNSVTPIISLAESGLKIVGSHANSNSNFPEQLTPKNIEHLNKSFTSIYNKSLWLKTFVDDYRKLIRIPQPITKEVNLKEFIGLCLHSLSEMLVKERVGAIADINNITLHIDPNLIEQVVVNLIKNSVEAMQTTENKLIEITAQEKASNILIHFTDNGEGISPENIPKIFIPFFTTKQGGSGIGLSLSKQIMQLHNGNIKVTVENGRTVFTLVFPGA